jgi:hypothetical protein
MNRQTGMSLVEVLISLFLSSILIVTLTQMYVNTKRNYLGIQKTLDTNFDLHWVSDLLKDSIRKAGFTPCIGIDLLETRDMRRLKNISSAIQINNSSYPSIQINRMNEVFSELISIQNPNTLIVSKHGPFDVKNPVIIADCDHAEVHQLIRTAKLSKGYLLTLAKPLHYSYSVPAYIGSWLEEQWFIKHNKSGKPALFYKMHHAEEISSLIHNMRIERQLIHNRQLIRIELDLDEAQTQKVLVAVRGS